jgi:hypothetical protein
MVPGKRAICGVLTPDAEASEVICGALRVGGGLEDNARIKSCSHIKFVGLRSDKAPLSVVREWLSHPKEFPQVRGGSRSIQRKRTAFPSGESGALSLMIAAWFRHRKLSPNVEFAGGDRFQRSVRLCS